MPTHTATGRRLPENAGKKIKGGGHPHQAEMLFFLETGGTQQRGPSFSEMTHCFWVFTSGASQLAQPSRGTNLKNSDSSGKGVSMGQSHQKLNSHPKQRPPCSLLFGPELEPWGYYFWGCHHLFPKTAQL